ncbi:BRO family protein [Novosphingobium sp. HII-3]|uniref:BRO-N domain-containing protein n=1 Tax=Novosphingobium sp. HII-3 TaxID=2075565 RepID=UPI000CDAD25C|nr:BRO family protein [Novosphingobium sp. HII-3]
MKALIPLHFEKTNVRMIMRDHVPWWVLNDVCSEFGIANPRDAASRLWDWQKDYVGITDAIGRSRRTLVINEAGIYGLAFNSRKPEVERFVRWLFSEVLPSIRQHGCYPPPANELAPQIDDQSPWDGTESTVGQRFREERERWEAETGYKLADTIPGFSNSVARAIEEDLGGIRKGARMEMLLYAEIDVLYVMTGRRTLTNAERALRNAYRVADPAQRTSILSSALALPPASDRD